MGCFYSQSQSEKKEPRYQTTIKIATPEYPPIMTSQFINQLDKIGGTKIKPQEKYYAHISDQQIISCAKMYCIKDKSQLDLVVQAVRSDDKNLVSQIFTPKRWKQFMANLNKKHQIYYRFKPQTILDSNVDQLTIQAVIIGPCGNGKTCLINHLCGTNQQYGQGKQSVTRNVNQFEVQFDYRPQFIVYDTPGTSAIKQRTHHAVLLKEILIWKRYNCIFVVIKFDSRYDQLIKKISLEMKLLKGYEKMIVFLISYFDQSEKPQQAMQTINEMLSELNIQNNIVFFSNKNCNQKALSDTLYGIAASMPKYKIQIDFKTFMEKFEISAIGQQIYFEKDIKQSNQSIEELLTIYSKFAVSLSNNQKKQAIYQDLEVHFKNEMRGVLDNFTNKFKTTITACSFYETFYSIQKKIIDTFVEFQRKIRSPENFKFIEYQTNGVKDIRDLIKQCPFCRIIWMRIQKCPNTTCGNRPSCYFDFTQNRVYRYKFTKVGKEIQIEEVNELNFLEINKIKQKQYIQSRDGRGKGCGQFMNFQTLPRLPNIDEILKEWYQVSNIEEANIRFLHQKDLEQTRIKLEKDARAKFPQFKHK